MTPAGGGTGRLRHLDGLRAVLAGYVVLHHALLTVFAATEGRLPGLAEPLVGWLRHGRVAVSAFLVVSGYSLAQSVLRSGRPSVGTFLRRRSRRILPPFWLATALSVLLLLTVLGRPTGTHWDVVLPLRLVDVLTTVTTVRQQGVNHVLWSVTVEWHLYFAFPALVWLLLRRGPAALAVVSVATGVLGAVAALAAGLPGVVAVTLLYGGLFGLGLAAAAAAQARTAAAPRGRSRAGLVAAVTAAALAGTLLVLGWDATDPAWLLLVDPLAGVCVAAALVHLATAPRSLLRDLLERPLLVRAGEFSYSTYLVHAPVLQLTWLVAVRPAGRDGLVELALMVAVGVPVAYAASRAFFLVAERPFLPGPPARVPAPAPTPAEPGADRPGPDRTRPDLPVTLGRAA